MRYLEYLEIEEKMGDWFSIDQMSYFRDDEYDENHHAIVRNGDLGIKYGYTNRIEEEEDFNLELYASFPNVILVDDYRNKKYKMKFYCSSCDNTFEKTGISVLNGGCPICRKSRYVGEDAVESELIKLGFDFVKQESDGCMNYKTGRELRFDFIINYNDIYIYIEVQGKQHYETVEYFGGDEAFDLCVFRDDIKKNFAEENGIYIALDYRESNKELLIDRLYEELSRVGVC